MKVVLVNVVNKILSTGRNCFEINDILNLQGIKCWTAYSYGVKTKNSFRISSPLECKYHAFMSRLTGKQGYYSYFSTQKLINFLEKEKPDIIHLNNLHGNYLNINTLLEYLKEKKIATVITLHDCWMYTGKCTHYSNLKCYKWKTGCYECQKLKLDHNSWFLDRTKKLWKDKLEHFREIPYLAVIGVSDWITNEAKQSPFFSNAKIIKRIYNWIDLDVFKPEDISGLKKELYGDKKIYLGIASIWDDRKGLNKFIEISKKLNKDEIIILIGNIKNKKLPSNIINIPRTENIKTLVKYYNMADLFIQLSTEESFGKVVAEALSCGIQVLTNNNTANPELIPKSCGMILNSLDTELVYSSIQKMMKNIRNRNDCRTFAIKNFNKNILINQHIDLYRKLLKIKEGELSDNISY